MEVKYSTSKNDVMRFYIKRWKEALWKHHIFIFACVSFIAYYQLSNSQLASLSRMAISLMIGFFVLSVLPLIPLVMHKKHTRSLSITNEGIETTIGEKRGRIPWNKIVSVQEEDGYVYITGRNQNGFIIPTSAFNDVTGKNLFLNKIKEYIDQPTDQL